jgi:hypothetical protein
MRHFLAILFILTGLTVDAQTLSGVVADGETNKPLYAVTIVNIATQESVYSNENGKFTIRAKAGDQVAFSFIGYKDARRTVSSSIGINSMRVELVPTAYSLGEVVILPNYTPYQLDSVRRRSTYQRALARQKTTSIMSPVSLLAEKLSKQSKMVHNFQKNFVKWENERFVDSRYTRELITQLTGLKDDSLGQFMVAYPMPYDYARNATELELQMWIRHNYKNFKKQLTASGTTLQDSTLKK